MSRVPYFAFYPADFMNGVRGLTPQEVGVYTMLLCRIYEESGPVEYHVRRLATYCGMRETAFASVVEKLVDLDKLQLVEGKLFNRRAEGEIQKRSDGLKIASKAGKVSAEKRQQKQGKPATPVQQPFNHTDTDTDTDKERDTTAKAIVSAQAPKPASLLADLASPESIASFVAYRSKTKRAALTATAANRLATHLREIFDGGGDPSEALAMAEERGWLTVEPEWYFNAKVKNGKRSGNQSPSAGAFDEIAAAARAR